MNIKLKLKAAYKVKKNQKAKNKNGNRRNQNGIDTMGDNSVTVDNLGIYSIQKYIQKYIGGSLESLNFLALWILKRRIHFKIYVIK